MNRRIVLFTSIVCLVCAAMLISCASRQKESIQVACIGDSITAVGYPEQLSDLLGKKYEVSNFGKPGAMIKSGDRFSYSGMDEYQESLDLQADNYIIMLGTNDCQKMVEWDEEEFRADYAKLFDSYIGGCPDAKIYTMICPAIDTDASILSGGFRVDILYNSICPIIAELSADREIETIDLLSLTLKHPEWSDDGVHPNKDGMKGIAKYIYSVIHK
ncbi:MAG: GDSL-type esterase/lipase family protein [Clostridia bacterium]